VVKSHRPVHAFTSRGGGEYDLNGIATPINPNFTNAAYEISEPPQYPPQADGRPLGWVGRNHGRAKGNQFPRTNFLYCDGHVETKTIEDTLKSPNWQWGEKIYSLQGEPLIFGVNPR
jgi:prepilin-type processing-associated H-X9-DG protein